MKVNRDEVLKHLIKKDYEEARGVVLNKDVQNGLFEYCKRELINCKKLHTDFNYLRMIEDFEDVDQLFGFSADQREIVVSIPLVDDVFPEETEQFEVILEASPGVFIDSPARALVTIFNDDPELPGTCR